ncbi:MAG: hypothetical protein ABIG93_02350 [archaeon]|nr:hypothetical protein [Nanoarchaeota archaeon]
MKKILMLLVIICLVLPLAFAQGNSPETTGVDNSMREENSPDIEQGPPEGAGNDMVIMPGQNNGTPAGLEMAMSKVQNENALQQLQVNMNQFQERYQERLQNMEGLEITDVDEETGEITLKAREQVKYLGFINGKATKHFEVKNDGEIIEKQPWYRFMYIENKEE